ncbi:hypothetical protein ACKI2N_020170 [Cupriavidus sp. 30B13]|uniref:hypothetical protein n=1 Tax=Cupriavidus sp. 30B13 TaxID=3384241 RepID=UPI003B8F0C8E
MGNLAEKSPRTDAPRRTCRRQGSGLRCIEDAEAGEWVLFVGTHARRRMPQCNAGTGGGACGRGGERGGGGAAEVQGGGSPLILMAEMALIRLSRGGRMRGRCGAARMRQSPPGGQVSKLCQAIAAPVPRTLKNLNHRPFGYSGET